MSPSSPIATVTTMDECRIAYCHECKRPLMAIDCYGARLTGCMTCNIWWAADGAKKRLAEEDLRALHQMMRDDAYDGLGD
jgi:hypothetical protein